MDRPIRILELRSATQAGGGPEKTIFAGAARADRRRFQITVTYVRDAQDEPFAIAEVAARSAVDYTEIRERHSFDWAVVPALQHLVRTRGIDIVHAHDYKTDLLALVLAHTANVQPLSTAHGWTGHSARERMLYYPLDRLLLRRFPRVVAVSRGIANVLVGAGVRPERIVTILNGIDQRQYQRIGTLRQSARCELDLRTEHFVIGAVGRLEQQKRFDLLIDACAQLRRPDLRLLIAGDGSLRSSLESQARRLFPSGECRLLGHCRDISRFHHALDLFVQSSDYEGSPNCVLEAMALETPLVATTAGGTAEIVRHRIDGLLAPCGDASALAAAIEVAMNDDQERMARTRAARQRVEHELSFDARQEKLEMLYEGLARNCRTASQVIGREKRESA